MWGGCGLIWFDNTTVSSLDAVTGVLKIKFYLLLDTAHIHNQPSY